ncbi:MAG TPA: hypothetical protein VJ436_02480 [Anaerolineales bacterium]|nr:hypothetical protein [Anaerolineales bacterium]
MAEVDDIIDEMWSQRGAIERGYRGAILEQSFAILDSRYTQFTLEISPHIFLDELDAFVD